jgi:hypothetical protein
VPAKAANLARTLLRQTVLPRNDIDRHPIRISGDLSVRSHSSALHLIGVYVAGFLTTLALHRFVKEGAPKRDFPDAVPFPAWLLQAMSCARCLYLRAEG